MVEDNGPGVPEKIREKIFDPFFTTKHVDEGTGIGLSLVSNFVKQMGGEISVANTDLGARLELSLPVKVVDRDESNTQKNFSSERPGKPVHQVNRKLASNLKAIVVDDEEGIRDLMEDYLSEMGVQHQSFSSAESALNYIEKNAGKVDIVFSDIKMKGIDGPSFMDQIKRHLLEKDQPYFVLITGGVQPELKINGVLVKDLCDAFLYKPIHENKLNEIISYFYTEKPKVKLP